MKLVVLVGPDAGQEFPLEGARVAIGRGMGNEVVLQDKEVSRRHAEIYQTTEGLAITDLGSTNGTFVNDAPIRAGQPLQLGDRIGVGSTVLSVEEGTAIPVSVPEWAAPAERQTGFLPLAVIGAIAVVAVLVVILSNRGPVSLPGLIATPTVTRVPTWTRAVPTSTPVSTRTSTATPRATSTVGLCANPDVRITSPLPGSGLTGVVEVHGTASISDFDFYKLEYGVGAAPTAWSAIGAPVRTAARDARLAVWDTTVLPEGEYTLRLTVVDNTGNFPPPCDVGVSVKR